jgi:hypothetical protein
LAQARKPSIAAPEHVVLALSIAEDRVIACHRRSYDRGEQIEDPAHVQALVDAKHAAHQHSANDRLAHAAPASQILLNRAAENGANLGAITTALIHLLDRYGAAALQDAILDAMLNDVPHHSAVRRALERQRMRHGGEPPVAIILPPHVRDRDAPVRPHALETYDQLKDNTDEAIAHAGNIPAPDDNV